MINDDSPCDGGTEHPAVNRRVVGSSPTWGEFSFIRNRPFRLANSDALKTHSGSTAPTGNCPRISDSHARSWLRLTASIIWGAELRCTRIAPVQGKRSKPWSELCFAARQWLRICWTSISVAHATSEPGPVRGGVGHSCRFYRDDRFSGGVASTFVVRR